MSKIVGVGSLIVDITGYAPKLPVDGETVLGRTVKFGPGGKGNNQMTAAHRAGAEVKIISRAGNDFLSSIMLNHYKNEKMSDEYITVSDGSETGSALIEVDEKSAQNRIVVVKGACSEITALDVKKAEKDFADCDVVITQLETSMESIVECKKMAQKYGKPFILNPAPFQEIPKDLFDGTDYITPNETEAEFFSGVKVDSPESAKAAAEVFLKMGVKNVIITLGKSGAYFTDGKKETLIPSISVNAVDTTGAGDAFNGGFAAAISFGMSPENALKFANCVGALSVTKFGTAPAMPTSDEIDEMFEKVYGLSR